MRVAIICRFYLRPIGRDGLIVEKVTGGTCAGCPNQARFSQMISAATNVQAIDTQIMKGAREGISGGKIGMNLIAALMLVCKRMAMRRLPLVFM